MVLLEAIGGVKRRIHMEK